MQQQNQEMQQQEGGEEYFRFQFQNGVCQKVMTDEQIEELRKHIAAYAVISEQLAEMHKAAMSAHQDFSGSRIRSGNLYTDPIVASVPVGHKITARQRWTPTALQLQFLESIYERGNGTPPSKQKTKEITAELAQHGPISETNVYNWFQNRRARSKKKQQASGSGSTNKAPEAYAEGLATKEKMITKPATLEFINNNNSTQETIIKPATLEFINNSTQIITKPAPLKFIDNSTQETMNKPATLEFINSSTQIMTKPATLEFIDNSTQGVDEGFSSFQNSDTAGIEQLIGKVESSIGYDDPYNLVEKFDLLG